MKINANTHSVRQMKTGIKDGNSISTEGFSLKDIFRKSEPNTLNLIPAPAVCSGLEKPENIQWQKNQMPAIDLGTDTDGRKLVGNLRCGFIEAVNNTDWQPQFKEVSIDTDKVKDVYMVIEPFAPEWIAGHALSYFEFEDDGKIKTSDGQEERGLVLSIEARLKEGEEYSLLKGMKKTFKNIYQLGTWKDTVQKAGRKEGHKLIRYKLDLTKEEKKAFLEKSLEESFKDRSDDYYNTLNNSCYSNQVRLLNSVLPEEKRVNKWIIPHIINNPGANLPNAAGFALGSRGILTDDPPVKTNPDKKLYPDNQVKSSSIGQALKSMSDTKAWEAMSGLTGMVAGASLCNLILPSVVAIPVGGVLGGVAGVKIGDWIKRESHAVREDCEKYFTE